MNEKLLFFFSNEADIFDQHYKNLSHLTRIEKPGEQIKDKIVRFSCKVQLFVLLC